MPAASASRSRPRSCARPSCCGPTRWRTVRRACGRRRCELLLALLAEGVHPGVPSRGSLGASGDLAPLAHLALALIGEGEAEVGGELLPGAEALRRGRPRAAGARGQGGAGADQRHPVHDGDRCAGAGRRRRAAGRDRRPRRGAVGRGGARLAHAVLARAPGAAAAPRADRVGREPAARCSTTARSSHPTLAAAACRTPTRCAARRRCTAPRATRWPTPARSCAIEVNAATDNPLVFAEAGEVLSDGNFHGEPVALALDFLADRAGRARPRISERRIERLVNPALSTGCRRSWPRTAG